MSVSIRAAFHLVSAEDGSAHVIESFGEALDAGDKGTSKAMTAAYKYAILHTFCIPVAGAEDPDASSHRLRKADVIPEPVQGWDQWTLDICEVLRVCESKEAIDRVQDRNRTLFTALRRERPELYVSLGESIVDRRQALSASHPARNEKIEALEGAGTKRRRAKKVPEHG